MKKLFALASIALAALTTSAMTPSRVFTDSIDSKTLGRVNHINIYLPDGFGDDADRTYPVIYLLHGKWGDNLDWATKGQLKEIADMMVRSGEMEHAVIVMPNAGEDYQTELFGYFDLPKWPFETYFFEEMMPEVERRYAVDQRPGRRAIMGLSMGGGGSLTYAQRHPGVFSSCYAMSALADFPEDAPLGDFEPHFIKACIDNSNVRFVRNADEPTRDRLRQTRWFVDCGDDDFLLDCNLDFYRAMREAGIPCELRIRDGQHQWVYWTSALYTALPFASRCFHSGE